MASFKVLLVYPNLMLVSTLPNNIALLSACLKGGGMDVRLFDATLYRTADKTNDELRVERMQVRPFNIRDAGVSVMEGDIFADFVAAVEAYGPDLIAVSVVDDTMKLALALLSRLKGARPPVVLGGVHATFNAEKLLAREGVDFVCVGEGEETLVELCRGLQRGEPVKGIRNLWLRDGEGSIARNPLRPAADIDRLPFEDFTIFDKKRLYRPMQGRMLSTLPMNLDRGCPYQCSFCCAPAISGLYRRSCGVGYGRRKTIERIRSEIEHQVRDYRVDYIYFNSETFLAMPGREFKAFCEMYSEFKLPFWCQTAVDTITEAKVRSLKELNCDRISVGLEHGNERFRKAILKKHFSNAQVVRAFDILAACGVKASVNNMIGFPDETRELVFDTIRLNRRIKSDSINGFVFQPYTGTALREYCIRKGYIQESDIVGDIGAGTPIGDSILRMPQLPRDAIQGLLRTFVLYARLPESYFPEIEAAERADEAGDKKLGELRELLFSRYF